MNAILPAEPDAKYKGVPVPIWYQGKRTKMKTTKILSAGLLVSLCLSIARIRAAETVPVYPGKEWD